MMNFRSALSIVSLVALLAADVARAGNVEIQLREADTVFSDEESLELVLQLAVPTSVFGRVDVARVELVVDVGGEAESFVPFMVVISSVEYTGTVGEYRSLWPEVARELILQPGEQVVRMDATRLVRRWLDAGGDMYLRIHAVQPVQLEHGTGSIQLRSDGGMIGKIVLVTR